MPERKHIDIPFEIKEADVLSDGSFKGFGSTFGGKPDSYGDVVNQGAFSKTIKEGGRSGNGVALLWQHNAEQPIGVWNQLEETSKGLKVHGQLAMKTQLGQEAYELLKMKAIKGLSIGFDTKDFEIVESNKGKTRTRYLKEVALWEISLVTFPANTRASVTSIKEMKTERDLENYLRESGNLTKAASQYLVKLCRPALIAMRDSDDSGPTMMESILDGLKQMNIK